MMLPGGNGPVSMEELEWWVALNMVPGIGPVRYRRLLERFGSAKDVFHAKERDLALVDGIGPEMASAISGGLELLERAKREVEVAERKGIKILVLHQDGYPKNLLGIFDPPPVLYVRGQILPSDELAIAVVGTRSATEYGRLVAEKMGSELARRGITVISGLARGIDSAAHRGALSARGRNLAVLACGVDLVYPPENRDLARRIAENGALISEFPLGTKPVKQNFPMRNRVISGLALGTVVVEAGDKSGALITAAFALDQGREVYAVPGNITSRMSKGTNGLIKRGAKLVDSVEDIVEDLSDLFKWIKVERPEEPIKRSEALILEILEEGPMHMDLLMERSGMGFGELSAALIGLQLKGLVRQMPGDLFSKV